MLVTWYVETIQAYPIISAAVQFALLGTAGEIVSSSITSKRFKLPCNYWQLFQKILAWALLGIIIKYGFTGMKGFTRTLIENNLLPAFCADGIGWALSVSVLTNLLFGPQMMFFHRLEDNFILKEKGYKGITTAWWTLIWFWIPAHTVTFILPKSYQIGLAAMWGLILGIILGFSKK